MSLACLELLAKASGAGGPDPAHMLLSRPAVDAALSAAEAVIETDKMAALVAAASRLKELLVPYGGATSMDS